MEGAWNVCGKYVEDVWKVCGKCVESVWKVCGRCVESTCSNCTEVFNAESVCDVLLTRPILTQGCSADGSAAPAVRCVNLFARALVEVSSVQNAGGQADGFC